MTLKQFISRWAESGDAERANKDSFLNELCDVLGAERPHPKTGDPARDLYVFEKDVARTRAGGISIGRVDLYNPCGPRPPSPNGRGGTAISTPKLMRAGRTWTGTDDELAAAWLRLAMRCGSARSAGFCPT